MKQDGKDLRRALSKEEKPLATNLPPSLPDDIPSEPGLPHRAHHSPERVDKPSGPSLNAAEHQEAKIITPPLDLTFLRIDGQTDFSKSKGPQRASVWAETAAMEPADHHIAEAQAKSPRHYLSEYFSPRFLERRASFKRLASTRNSMRRQSLRIDDIESDEDDSAPVSTWGERMMSCCDFESLINAYKMATIFGRFSPDRLDNSKAVKFDAFAMKTPAGPATKQDVIERRAITRWRNVSVEIDTDIAEVRLFDNEKGAFICINLSLELTPTLRPSFLTFLDGVDLGGEYKSIQNLPRFCAFWVEGSELPIVLIHRDNRVAIEDLCLSLMFVTAYKSRIVTELMWQDDMEMAILSQCGTAC